MPEETARPLPDLLHAQGLEQRPRGLGDAPLAHDLARIVKGELFFELACHLEPALGPQEQ